MGDSNPAPPSASGGLFVSAIQDPFQKKIASIVDPLGKLREAGTLTYEQALQGQTDLETQIAAFQDSAKEYAGLGKGQALQVKQGMDTLNPIIESWRNTFKNDLATLPPAPKVPEPPKPPEAPPQLTPAELLTQSTAAAEMQAKRAKSAQGRSSTILTGANLGTAITKRQTLLGY